MFNISKNIKKLKNNEKNLNFTKINTQLFKLVILTYNNLMLFGFFSAETRSMSSKLYLLHILTSFINFMGNTHMDGLNLQILEILNNKTTKTQSEIQNNFVTIKNIRVSIFSEILAKCLTSHFCRVYKDLIKNEEIYTPSIKFKNMYIIDLSTNELLFDLMHLRNKPKFRKFYKNEKLWQEILHHSGNLMNSYISEFQFYYYPNEISNRFVKFECTSTYPRLTCMIKFIPILKGIAIIHIYSQNKLSRILENSNYSTNNEHNVVKGYKEIDIFYGTDLKENNNMEFKYSEPKKLKEIEEFFVDFFISSNPTFNLFTSLKSEIKYFDINIMRMINEQLERTVEEKELFFFLISNFQEISKKSIFTDDYSEKQNDINTYIFQDFIKDFFIENPLLEKSHYNETITLSKIEDKNASNLEDEHINFTASRIKKADVDSSKTLDLVLSDLFKKSPLISEHTKQMKFSPNSKKKSNKGSCLDILSQKIFESKKNNYEKSNNSKLSELKVDVLNINNKTNSVKDNENEENNTHNNLIAEAGIVRALINRKVTN